MLNQIVYVHVYAYVNIYVRGIFWPAENRLASQEGLLCME